MTDAYRPPQYLEYRDAAAAILARESGEAAVRAFGLSELLSGGEPADDLTPVYAFLEAQGAQVGTSVVLARLGLLGLGETVAPQALLGLPLGSGPWLAVPGLTAGTPVVVDRPGLGLVLTPGDGVRARPGSASVADPYLSIVDVDPAGAVVVVPEGVVASARPALLARVQLGAAAELLGLVHRMLEDAIAYTRLRRQFGRAISSFQVVQHLLGWAATERHQLASLYDLAVHHGHNPDLSAAVKALAGRVAHAVAQTATQVTGGISFTWEYSLNRPHHRALALDQFAGSSADLIAAMGRRIRTERAVPELFGLAEACDTP